MQRVLPSEDWFVGLIEGEGSFTHDIDRGYYTPAFQVAQKERQVCDLLVDFFGFGSTVSDHVGKSYSYQVQHYKNCRRIACFLVGRLVLDKRREQFVAWCEQFGLLDDSKFDSSGNRVPGEVVLTPVQKWMKAHPEEVTAIAMGARVIDSTKYEEVK